MEVGLARAAEGLCKMLPVYLGHRAEVNGDKMLAAFKVDVPLEFF